MILIIIIIILRRTFHWALVMFATTVKPNLFWQVGVKIHYASSIVLSKRNDEILVKWLSEQLWRWSHTVRLQMLTAPRASHMLLTPAVLNSSQHWHCATSSHADECDITYLCKYIQIKLTSRTLQCTLNVTYVRFKQESWRNILRCPLRRALTFE